MKTILSILAATALIAPGAVARKLTLVMQNVSLVLFSALYVAALSPLLAFLGVSDHPHSLKVKQLSPLRKPPVGVTSPARLSAVTSSKFAKKLKQISHSLRGLKPKGSIQDPNINKTTELVVAMAP